MELEQKVGQLTQQLEGMSAEREQVKGVADRFQGMEDRMKALLQLSEILSVRYNPFLEHEEPSLYDDRDANAFLPRGAPPDVANVARRSSLAEVVPIEPEDGPDQPTATGDATEASALGADALDDMPSHASVAQDAGPAGSAQGDARTVGPDAITLRMSAQESPPVQAASPLASPEPASGAQAAPDGQLDGGDNHGAAPLDAAAAHRTGPDQGPDARPSAAHEDTEAAEPPAAQAHPAPAGTSSVLPRAAASSAGHRAPPRLAYQALCWFERLAQQGDPSEIHLFLEQYCRLGWIPAHHQEWMHALACSIAPRREGLAWADVPLRPDELARLHRQHLRLLDQMFRTGFPDDRPDAWERQAVQALEED